jgi:hypothetical protein
MFLNTNAINTIGAADPGEDVGDGPARCAATAQRTDAAVTARRRRPATDGPTLPAAIIATTNINQNSGYTPVRMAANAVGALSQAHSENRVYRSGNPAGAIFICRDCGTAIRSSEFRSNLGRKVCAGAAS